MTEIFSGRKGNKQVEQTVLIRPGARCLMSWYLKGNCHQRLSTVINGSFA